MKTLFSMSSLHSAFSERNRRRIDDPRREIYHAEEKRKIRRLDAGWRTDCSCRGAWLSGAEAAVDQIGATKSGSSGTRTKWNENELTRRSSVSDLVMSCPSLVIFFLLLSPRLSIVSPLEPVFFMNNVVFSIKTTLFLEMFCISQMLCNCYSVLHLWWQL